MTLPVQACLILCISTNSMEMKETFPEIWKRLEEIHYQQDFKKETSPPLFTLENKGHTK